MTLDNIQVTKDVPLHVQIAGQASFLRLLEQKYRAKIVLKAGIYPLTLSKNRCVACVYLVLHKYQQVQPLVVNVILVKLVTYLKVPRVTIGKFNLFLVP